MAEQGMKVVGYARVSTEHQLENYSIEEQTARLASYCAAKGWTLLKTYIDGGYSGGNTHRPALQQLLEAVRGGGIGAVVVYKLDRLSRSQKDTLTLIEDELLAHGTDFVSINENFDTSTPFGRAMIGMLSVFAQLEKDQITERFTMGRLGRGKAGYFHGGGSPPTGYDYIDGRLVVNEYEAAQVREVFAAFLAGKSINAISRAMDGAYLTKWTAAKVRSVLRNSVYIGKVHFLGQEFQGVHAPLIGEETFQAAARALACFSREARKASPQRTPFRAGYLLSGLLFCKRCGARYSANHGYYKCYSRAKSSPKFILDPSCKNDHWRIADLDRLVLSQAGALVTSGPALDALRALAGREGAQQPDQAALRRRLRALEGQLEKLADLYQVGALPLEALRARAGVLAAEKGALEARLQAPGEAPACDLFQDGAANCRAGLDCADLERKRALLGALIGRICIDGRRVEIFWRV